MADDSGAHNGQRFRIELFHIKGSTHPSHTKELRAMLDKLNVSAEALKFSDADVALLLQQLVDDLRKAFDRRLEGNLNEARLRDLLDPIWHGFLD